MSRRQRDDVLELAPENWAAPEQHRSRATCDNASEGGIEVAFARDPYQDDLQAKRARCCLYHPDVKVRIWIQQDSNESDVGYQRVQ
jgi:hypothetical protein